VPLISFRLSVDILLHEVQYNFYSPKNDGSNNYTNGITSHTITHAYYRRKRWKCEKEKCKTKICGTKRRIKCVIRNALLVLQFSPLNSDGANSNCGCFNFNYLYPTSSFLGFWVVSTTQLKEMNWAKTLLMIFSDNRSGCIVTGASVCFAARLRQYDGSWY